MNPGTEVATITAGLDRLYRRMNAGNDVLDKEGLVPVYLIPVEAEGFDSWAEADARLAEVEKRLGAETDELRRAYLGEMIDSLRALIGTFQDPHALSYQERVRRCLRVPPEPVPETVLAGYRTTIATALNDLGYDGRSIDQALPRWEAEARVADDDVLPTIERLLHEARQRTESLMFEVPEGTLKPVGVHGVPFAAYCDYPGRQLILNLDFGYTLPALKHLACHEGFPGHLVHMALREALTASGAMPLDGALVVTSSASSPLFEGIAENGIQFLDWVEGPADRLSIALNRLRSAARINAAYQIHAEQRAQADVVDYLVRTCYQPERWAQSRLAFLTHPLRAPFIYAYWYGDQAVERVWQRVEPAQRAAFWRYLYENMHTPATLDNYWPVRQPETQLGSHPGAGGIP